MFTPPQRSFRCDSVCFHRHNKQLSTCDDYQYFLGFSEEKTILVYYKVIFKILFLEYYLISKTKDFISKKLNFEIKLKNFS